MGPWARTLLKVMHYRHRCLLCECLALGDGSGPQQEAGCALGARLGHTAPALDPGEPGSPPLGVYELSLSLLNQFHMTAQQKAGLGTVYL